MGIRSLVRQICSPIVRQSYRQHEYDVCGISKTLLFPIKLIEERLKYILYKVIQTKYTY